MMLLDTHVALWFARGSDIAAELNQRIDEARNGDGVLLSAVTVWEIGNLIRLGRVEIDVTLAEWVTAFLDLGGFNLVSLTTDIVIEAAGLPGPFHTDPADRFLVATARNLDIPIVTRDKRILEFAEIGHVKAIRC